MATVDIRAKVYCSLGTVITGNFADSYAQSSGLIFTRGSVELKGIVRPDVGSKVEFAYATNTYVARLPRTLRVLSSFADPFRNVTTVQLGCLLTFLENRKPPIENPNSKEENSTAPCYVFNRATLPISAEYVVQQILTALGIESEAIPLTNYFSVDEFDLSAGFISVLSDLIVSEGYLAFLDEQEILRFRDLGAEVGTGPLIDESQIIELGPIGVGDLPADSVIVRYSSRRLKPPDELESEQTRAERMWEWEETQGADTEISISYVNESNQSITVTSTYRPYTFTATAYDLWDRVVEQFTYEINCIAEVNNRWAIDRYRYGGSFDAAGALVKNFTDPAARVTFEKIVYKKQPPILPTINLRALFLDGGVLLIKNTLESNFESDTGNAIDCVAERPDDYSEVISKESLTYASEAEVAGTLNVDSFAFRSGGTNVLNSSSTIYAETSGASYSVNTQVSTIRQGTSITVAAFDTAFTSTLAPSSKIVIKYELDKTSGITKTRTDSYMMYGKTTTGQQDLATRANDPPEITTASAYQAWIDRLVQEALDLRFIGSEVRIRTEREFGLERRPSQQDRNNSANAKPEVTEQVAEVTWVSGGVESTNYIEFSLPYAPDDRIEWSVGSGYTSTPSDASTKALRYGRIQNRLLLGNRAGLSLQLPASVMPRYPFDPLYVSAASLVGQYRVNGCTWSFDANGIVASADCLFWGGTGENP